MTYPKNDGVKVNGKDDIPYIYILWNIKFMFETTNQNMPGKMIIITLYILSSFLWFGNRRRNADKKKGVVRPWKVIYKWKKIIELGTDGVAITYLEPLGFSMVADKKILGISKHKAESAWELRESLWIPWEYLWFLSSWLVLEPPKTTCRSSQFQGSPEKLTWPKLDTLQLKHSHRVLHCQY